MNSDSTSAAAPQADFDAAFVGGESHFVDDVGRRAQLDVDQWSRDATPADRALFITPCRGSTIDIGCGPGRLVAALAADGVAALGVDSSAEAVRLTRERDVPALCCDIFGDVPGDGQWSHALLADGNVGIGGRPARLLRRVRDLLAPGGTLHVELEGHGIGIVRDRRRIRVDGRIGEPFDWARVGIDAIDQLAYRTGFLLTDIAHVDGRYVAVLTRSD